MAEPTEHVHVWQPNGSIEVDRMARSPVNSMDDLLWKDILALAVCECGKVQRTKVGENDVRRRWADDRRRQRR